MPESLGEAVLTLRTDDSQLDAGIDKAEASATALGGTFDKTSASVEGLSSKMTQAGQSIATGAAAWNKANDSVTASTNNSNAAQLILQSTVRRTMDQWAAGAPITTIFAEHIAALTEAAEMSGGSFGKFGEFLSGGWGIAIGVAVSVLGPLIAKLIEGSNAASEMKQRMQEAAQGADAFGDAQSMLGKMIDLTTDKLKVHNETLKAAIRYYQLLAAEQGKKAIADTSASLQSTASQTVGGPYRTAQNIITGGVLNQLSPDQLANPEAKSIVDALIASNGKGVDQAIQQLDQLNKTGKLSQKTYEQLASTALDYAKAQDKVAAAQAVINALDGKGLDPRLVPYHRAPKPRRPRKGPAMASDEDQDKALAQLSAEELRAQLDVTTNISDRAELQLEILDQERDAKVAEIEGNKKLNDQQKAARLAEIDKLYGKPATTDANGDVVVQGQPGLLAQKIQKEYEQKALEQANDQLQRQADALYAQAQITVNLKDRNALEQKANDLQEQIQANMLEQQIANGQVADADKARATLAQQQAAQRAALLKAQEGPLAQYQDQIRSTASNMNDEIQSIEVEGLKNLNEGLADAIMGAKSLGDVFHDVAAQIVKDLLEIAIQQAVIKPLATLLGGGSSGGGGGIFGSLFSGLLGGLGGGGVSNADIFSGASNGAENVINNLIAGARASGGPVNAGSAYIVGEKRPEIFVPDTSGTILPNLNSLGASNDNSLRSFNLNVSVSGARGNAEIEDMVSSGVNKGIASYDQVVASRVQDKIRRGQ